jgi:hypothetical protein
VPIIDLEDDIGYTDPNVMVNPVSVPSAIPINTTSSAHQAHEKATDVTKTVHPVANTPGPSNILAVKQVLRDEDKTPVDTTIDYKVSSFSHLHSDFCTCPYLIIGTNVFQSRFLRHGHE